MIIDDGAPRLRRKERSVEHERLGPLLALSLFMLMLEAIYFVMLVWHNISVFYFGEQS